MDIVQSKSKLDIKLGCILHHMADANYLLFFKLWFVLGFIRYKFCSRNDQGTMNFCLKDWIKLSAQFTEY